MFNVGGCSFTDVGGYSCRDIVTGCVLVYGTSCVIFHVALMLLLLPTKFAEISKNA